MKNEKVAVLNIRSRKVDFQIGARGVNGTFVFAGSKCEDFEGFTKDGFLDELSFSNSVTRVVNSVLENYSGKCNEIFVSVPSVFTELYTKGHAISFSKRRKISTAEIDNLFEAGLYQIGAKGRFIKNAEMYLSVGDNRKYFSVGDVLGASSSVLQGGLSYFFAREDFCTLVEKTLNRLGFSSIVFFPQTLAETSYLLPAKCKEGYAVFLDLGFLTSSVTVAYGNGFVHEKSFDFGTGQILLSIMDEFAVDYETALEILASSDVSGGNIPKELTWTDSNGNSFSVRQIGEIVKCGLDQICESVETFLGLYYKDEKIKQTLSNPYFISGECVDAVKGVSEHISKRLNHLTETVYPDVPYHDKPSCSSEISALNFALIEKKQNNFGRKIFNFFGGKTK